MNHGDAVHSCMGWFAGSGELAIRPQSGSKSVLDERRSGLLHALGRHATTGVGDDSGIKVGMEADEPSPAQPHYVDAVVVVRSTCGQGCPVMPLDDHGRVPRPPANRDVLDAKSEARKEW